MIRVGQRGVKEWAGRGYLNDLERVPELEITNGDLSGGGSLDLLR
jgi:hypothetical protein